MSFLSQRPYLVWVLAWVMGFSLNLLGYRLFYIKTWDDHWLVDILAAAFLTTAEVLLIPLCRRKA